MSTIPLFDALCGVSVASAPTEIPGAAAVSDELTRLDVGRALVRALPAAREFDTPDSNARLLSVCAAHDRLVPCPVVLPNSGRDLDPEPLQVETLIRQGARAVVLRPRSDGWLTEPWCSGALTAALEARRMPALCLADEWSFEQLAAVAGRHPDLPLIACGLSYRQQRIILPMLEHFTNIRISLGAAYCVFGGIEQMVTVVGADRIVFGSGYPEYEILPAATYLLYAAISAEQKRLIGTGNLDALLEGVR